MHLYNLTLQGSNAAIQAVVGNFSGSQQQEILVSHETSLELFVVDAQTGKMSSVVATDVFASIRSLACLRMPRNTKDLVVVGSDSGRLAILEFQEETGNFLKLHQETYGKSGVRRIVPGQFLATDPKGRCVMISAVEQSKLIYILNRDVTSNITISSPLEAHRHGSVIYDVVGIDVGFENPIFGVLEVAYSESDASGNSQVQEKTLTYYELDLGLNHIVHKWSEPTDFRANLLVQVPGGQNLSTGISEGPSGVLVCCEDHIIYQHMDVARHRVPIPHRTRPDSDQSSKRGLIIVAGFMHKMKKSVFFFLLQSEIGDIYKITLEHSDGQVNALKIKYFDTVPVSSSLCILKSGFIFAASEFGNQCLYQLQTLGDEDGEVEYLSTSYPAFGMSDPSTPLPHVYFRPQPLRNLLLTDEIHSLKPIIQSHVLSHSESPQILAACGRGSRSALRILRHGLTVEDLVNCDVSASPNGMWATKRTAGDLMDAYIILSFTNGTLVFSIGEELVEVQDAGFLSSVPSFAVQQLGSDSLVQVHPHGVRHISGAGQIQEWAVPSGKTIVHAATNKRQIVVALSSAEIVYFELDLDGQINEYQDRKATGSAILALGLGDVPEGRQRSGCIAVGCEDQTVRIFSLNTDSILEILSFQALASPPSSIYITEVPEASEQSILVHIGLNNGVLLRTVLDTSTGQLVDTSSRFLGTRPIRLSPVLFQGKKAILALSSRSWISCTPGNGLGRFAPLNCDALQHGCSFVHEISGPDRFLGIVGRELRILRLPKMDEKFSQRSMPLSHTPRQMVIHPQNGFVYVAESDHRVTDDERELLVNDEVTDYDYSTFGRPSAPPGSWASCIRVVDPTKAHTVTVVPLSNNEAAFSIAIVPFAALSGELMLIVGTAINVVLEPRSCTSGFLRVYKFNEHGGIKFCHMTEVEDVPLALLAFQGRLIAGIGRSLRIYENGKHKLLRKAENNSFSTTIVTLNIQGSRIIVGDMQQSLTFIAYRAPEERLIVVADDTQSRWTTCSTMLDYNTVVAGDRFGNIFVNRLDPKISDRLDLDVTGAGIMNEKGKLNGAPHKTQMIAHFHVGDMVTSIHKVALMAGAPDIILYTGLHGTIGILVPLVTKEDIGFFLALEQCIRTEQTSLVGRDHLSWRGYYAPVKAIVDGDLCETFSLLPRAKQRDVSGKVDRTIGEVLRKVEQIRCMSSGL
ncbi:CPSF A subunit region-domain-containing protein [Mycena sp. CBHHK59/15]|nr:CPSF A subunit region-domain-containing protein [Mycena sp. CBHHK59/15]